MQEPDMPRAYGAGREPREIAGGLGALDLIPLLYKGNYLIQ